MLPKLASCFATPGRHHFVIVSNWCLRYYLFVQSWGLMRENVRLVLLVLNGPLIHYLKSSLPLCKYPTISFSTVTTVNCACNALDCSLKLCALVVTSVGNFQFLYHLEHLYNILQCKRTVGLAESCHCVMVRVSFIGIETKQFYLCQYTESTSTHHS